MRDLVKSMTRFSWAMSLFGAKSLGDLLTFQPFRRDGRSASALDAVARAAGDQLNGGFKVLYQSGEQVQRSVLGESAASFESGSGSHLNPTPEQIAAIDASSDMGPVFALNLLRFKPDGGAEKFDRYVRKSAAKLPGIGASLVFNGVFAATAIGGDQHWDRIGLVKYPSLKAFSQLFFHDPEMLKLEVQRAEALEDSRLFLFKMTGV